MAVSKATQARIGFAAMILLAGTSILTPTIIKLRSGELDVEEEEERPGPPIYALHAILRGSPAVQSCVSQWERRSGAELAHFTLEFVLRPEGRAAVLGVSGVAGAEALQSCLEPAVAALELPPFEGEPQRYGEPFTP